MTKQIYRLKISLARTKPKVWRRVLVYSDTILVDLHKIIQTTMGWTNSHLHVFDNGMTLYAPKEFDIEETRNSRSVKLKTILKNEGSVIIYEYDFGDGWIHEILLEKIVEDEILGQIPRCITGKSCCPPEDCGGILGYAELLNVISNPKHEDFESIMDWLGDEFDPNYFDINEINLALSLKDYGCEWIE